jgi:hypothetical protein
MSGCAQSNAPTHERGQPGRRSLNEGDIMGTKSTKLELRKHSIRTLTPSELSLAHGGGGNGTGTGTGNGTGTGTGNGTGTGTRHPKPPPPPPPTKVMIW